jgi:hypothetical protein
MGLGSVSLPLLLLLLFFRGDRVHQDYAFFAIRREMM